MTAARSAFLLMISERGGERGRCVRDEKVKARVKEGEKGEEREKGESGGRGGRGGRGGSIAERFSFRLMNGGQSFKNVVVGAAHGDDRKASGNQGSRSRTCEAGESRKEREM